MANQFLHNYATSISITIIIIYYILLCIMMPPLNFQCKGHQLKQKRFIEDDNNSIANLLLCSKDLKGRFAESVNSDG